MAGRGRGRSGAEVALVVAAALLVSGCPSEADDARDVWFGVDVAYDGTFPRDPDPKRLVVGPADAEALGVDDPTSLDDFGSFVIRTSTTAEGDERFTHCLADPIVISDADTGEVDHTVPVGTCLTEGRVLKVG